MVDVRKLRKTYIIFKEENRQLNADFFEGKEKQSEDIQEKYFLRGCKHTVEKHYSEAIKWFQLVDDNDSTIMILLNAYKLGDFFLFSQYYTEELDKGNMFKRLGIQVFLKEGEREKTVSKSVLKEMYTLLKN